MPIIYAKWHVCKENLTKTVVNVCKSVIHGWIDSTKSSNKEILTKAGAILVSSDSVPPQERM
jgi:hypothetical protein